MGKLVHSALLFIVHLLFCIYVGNGSVFAQSLNPLMYNIGTPSVTDMYVDPKNGNDARNGTSRATALKTLTAAWNAIPQSQNLTKGVRINIMPGSLPESAIPNYMESRYGTYTAPIIIRAVDGAGTAILQGDLNVFDTKYLYLIDIKIASAGDAFHCEQCDHLLIRGAEFDGGARQAHETIKVNQSRHVYIENSNIHGADDNAIDFVAVQYGHILYNKVHNAQDWCAYVKGGSAYLRIEGNEFYNCGTGGFTAGQGTGFEFMTMPWLHYEAYDIKIINNVIHDTEGAGLGINGGYNILAAFNTLYRIGSRSHAVEVVYGLRSCDGNATRCGQYLASGGWGTTLLGTEGEPVGNRNVYIYNNIIYNPAGFSSSSEVFAIYGPRTPSSGTNLSSPQVTDQNLRIKGNVIWINSGNSILGIENDSAGCRQTNPTCHHTLLMAENIIDSFTPSFINARSGDFRPTESSTIFSVPAAAIPDFPGNDRPSSPPSEAGLLQNIIIRDRGNTVRTSRSAIGAYAVFNSPLTPGNQGGGGGNGANDKPPVITRASCTPRTARIKKNVSCTVKATDDKKISSVTIKIGKAMTAKLKLSRGLYKATFKAKKVKASGVVTVKDSKGQTKTKSLGKFYYR